MQIGKLILQDIEKLFPINRSLTGEGTKKTLFYYKKIFKKLKIKKVKSGSKFFDWKVPLQWEIKEAWIKNLNDETIVDFKENNLHVLGYSDKVNKIIDKKRLLKKIFTIKSLPKAIPYVTSYYKKNWGFCVQYEKIKNLKEKKYKVLIDSNFKQGFLNYGEILIKGKSKKEILLSTNICHPSMVNNELSGPTILIHLAKWLSKKKRKLSYRLIFVPETIGSIMYINKNIDKLKKNIIGGYTLTCLGDDGPFSFIKTKEDTLTNYITLKVLKNYKNKKVYSFIARGSDERQYGSPNVNLPIGSLCRTKHSEYKQYHTSLDNLNITSEEILEKSFNYVKKCINLFEKSIIYKTKIVCEPFFSKRIIHQGISFNLKNKKINNKDLLDILAYMDGMKSLAQINNILGMSLLKFNYNINILKKLKLIKKII